MRVVLDTNVLVAGVLSPHGPPGRLLDLVLGQEVTVLVDDRILREYGEVLRRPRFGLRRADVELLMEYLTLAAEPVVGRPLDVTLVDEDDLPFLEVAAAGQADALVTGNAKHFVPSRGRHEVHVLTPREAMTLL